jgi:hypothetical protein
LHKFKAATVFKDPVAIGVKDMIEIYGYKASDNTAPFEIKCVAALQRKYKTNPALTEKVFGVCVEIVGRDHGISAALFNSLFYLANTIDEAIIDGKNRDKLIRVGAPSIEAAIRREKHIVGMGGERVSAKAVLDLINKSRKKKIPFKEK